MAVVTTAILFTFRLNKQSISRVLFHPQAEATIIYLGTAVACRLKRLNPEGSAGRIIPSLFGLAPCGVYQASQSPDCWCALTAPFHPYLMATPQAVFFSMALSLGFPPLDVIQHTALWSPDFPHLVSSTSRDCLDNLFQQKKV